MTQTLAQISPIVLPLASAQELVRLAVFEAGQIGIPYTLTVVDGGTVVQVVRMDGAALARTSVYFGAPTAELVAAVQPGAPLYSIPNPPAVRR